MTGTALDRRQAATLADDRDYMSRQLPEDARRFASSMLCPAPWRIEKGDTPAVAEQKVADLTIVGQSLARLDMPLDVNVVPQVYVVHGRPGFMAQLQVMLAGRWGCLIVPLDEESDAAHAVVKVLGKDKEWHRVTVTMEEAKAAKWPERNPNYKSMPDRMLMARACTKAIALHCPEAKLSLPPLDAETLDELGPAVNPETGEILDRTPELEPERPPMSVAPDGSTITEPQREPAIDEDSRARLLAELDALDPAVLAVVKARARELAIPNLRSNRVTRAHGALVAMLIEHAKISAPAPDHAPDGSDTGGGQVPTSQGPERPPSIIEQLDASLAKDQAQAVTPEVVDRTPYGPGEEPFD